MLLIVDDNYLLMVAGYDLLRRTDDVIVHLRLLDDGKMLIEYDGIEYDIAHDLIAAGIAREDILLSRICYAASVDRKAGGVASGRKSGFRTGEWHRRYSPDRKPLEAEHSFTHSVRRSLS